MENEELYQEDVHVILPSLNIFYSPEQEWFLSIFTSSLSGDRVSSSVAAAHPGRRSTQ